MSRSLICKLLQKKTYDVLTKKYTIIALFFGFVIIIVSILHFGETLLEWSREKYSIVFHPFKDNIAGRSFQHMLCQQMPIDVVYSWVNGTDPVHLHGLALAKKAYGFSQPYTNSCHLSTCISSNMVLVKPSLPLTITFDNLKEVNQLFKDVAENFTVVSPLSSQDNVTVLVLSNIEMASRVAQLQSIVLHSINHTLHQAFMTTRSFSHLTVPLRNSFIVSDLPLNASQKQIMEKLSIFIEKTTIKVVFQQSRKQAIVSFKSDKEIEQLLANISSAEKRNLSIAAAHLVIELPADHEDISDSRFADNEELRYSLRSLERHAPWIQQIYIITNGQIPYWLNLDNPRVTIITHNEIFTNKSHLPTFSSPAIECHLHRIPNLSKKFLYLNDDVMFGKDVWPEDFYSHTKGQKVYLSWPVPNCAEGCPSSWIRDGYCDKPCNNSLCQFDGGDCSMDNPMLSYQGVLIHENGATNVYHVPSSQSSNCNNECVNAWLADRYCDKACNTQKCGFDAGDCGVEMYDQLYQIELTANRNEYQLPEGELVGYFNLTNFLLENYTITEAYFGNHAAIRMLAVSLKYSVLTVILKPDFNSTQLQMTFKGKKLLNPFEKTFTLSVNTRSKPSLVTESIPGINSTEETVRFEVFPKQLRHPKVLHSNKDIHEYDKVNISSLPEEIAEEIENLVSKVENGELTENGYWSLKSSIIRRYVLQYQAMYLKKPILVYNPTLSFQTIFHNKSSDIVSTKMPIVKSLVTSAARVLTTHFYETPSLKKRHLLDTFGDSLRHVNKLYNEAFGYEARKVPSHIAHFVDRDVMARLSENFKDPFDETSSHKIRRSNDMQFAFSYYYYLMSEMTTIPLGDIFDSFDVDHSGTWSDREIRTLLTRLNDLPLELSEVSEFHQLVINCSSGITQLPVVTPHYERFYETDLPIVTKQLVLSCKSITDLLMQQFGKKKRNEFEIVGEDEVAFKMIHNNLSHVLGQIDSIRKNPKKFVCLNDNMRHGTNEAETIRSVIQDFYESLFPARSQFELPPNYRNRFLYLHELQEWRRIRDWIRFATYLSLALLIIFAGSAFWKSQAKPKSSRNHSKRNTSSKLCQV